MSDRVGTFPEHLTAFWQNLSKRERGFFNGPRWQKHPVLHQQNVGLCCGVMRDAGLSLEDALAMCIFDDGLGSKQPLHANLIRAVWPRKEETADADAQAAEAVRALFANYLTYTDEPWDPDVLGQRPWIGPPYLMREEITLLHGPGGGGKSQLAIVWAIALALGRPFGRLKPLCRCRVVLINFEDNSKEQMRRISAALQFFNATPKDLQGWLYRVCVGPNGDATMFDLDATGSVHTTECWHALEYACEQIKPDVVFIDPLVAVNAVTENSNQLMRRVMVLARAGIAQRFHCALVLLHHDNKSGNESEDADAANVRGGSDIVNAVRFELAVKKMTKPQAEDMGIEADRRGYYFRLGSVASKLNYSAPEEAEWFERLAVLIDGEEVVRCFPWTPPNGKLSPTVADAVVAAVEKGTPSGPYSPQLGEGERSLDKVLEAVGLATTLARRRAIRELLRMGRIVKSEWEVREGRFRSGLRSDHGLPYNYKWQDLAGQK